MVTTNILKREDAPLETTCNKEILFAAWGDWQAEVDSIKLTMAEMAQYQGNLNESPTVLAEWFDKYSGYRRRIIRLLSYVSACTDSDSNDMTAKGNRGLIMGVFGQFRALIAFATPELQAMDEQLLDWAEEAPELAIYAHHFDDLLRQKKHTRSAEVEQIMGMLQDPFSSTYQTANTLILTDMKFVDALDGAGNTHPVAHATITPTGIQSPDREKRKNAWHSYCDGYLAFQNTLAANYITSVKQQVFSARARGYDSALHARLEPNNMPIDVFDNLINTFEANIGTWHRYWAVKARAIGVDKLHPYDIWSPVVDKQPVVPYEQAVEWIVESMKPLGADYVDVLRRGALEERWVDYAPNQGKMQGARASWAADCPPFIVMTYRDSLMDMSVLAHELGHSMHSYLMDTTQPDIYNGGISSSVAETASNFNQAMTRAYLAETKANDPTFQLAMIDEALFNFHRYFYQMPTLARFEYEVFSRAEAGKLLTADILNGIMRDLYTIGYGDTMEAELDRTQITWAQFQHLYMPFYTFQYAVGISAAHALADGVLADEAGAADRYLNFLSAGSSLYTMDLFETAGVDMTSPEPIEKAYAVLGDLVDRMEDLVS